jgi:hypothetical protein
VTAVEPMIALRTDSSIDNSLFSLYTQRHCLPPDKASRRRGAEIRPVGAV